MAAAGRARAPAAGARAAGRTSAPPPAAPATPSGRRAARAAPRRRAQSLPARLLVFVVLLAVLAVGRVALSFAVVQKNLQTDAVARQYRVVERREPAARRDARPTCRRRSHAQHRP